MKSEEEIKKILEAPKKSVLMTGKEKDLLLSKIVIYTKENPISNENIAGHRPVSTFASIFASSYLRYASATAVILMLVSFSSVSYAAQKSLPGDLLYPLKVGVNERVLGIVQFSDENKARYNMHLAELRMQELEQITAKEKLSEETSEKINAMLQNHLDKAKARVEKIALKEKNEVSAEINSEMEASLRAHKEVMKKLSTRDGQAIKDVLQKFDNKIDSAQKGRVKSEGKFTEADSDNMKTVAETRLSSIEVRINEISKNIENSKSNLTQDSYKSAKANLDTASQVIAQGKDSMEKGNHKEAFLLLQKANRILKETEISLKASLHLNIAVSEIQDEVQATAGAAPETEIENDKIEKDSN